LQLSATSAQLDRNEEVRVASLIKTSNFYSKQKANELSLKSTRPDNENKCNDVGLNKKREKGMTVNEVLEVLGLTSNSNDKSNMSKPKDKVQSGMNDKTTKSKSKDQVQSGMNEKTTKSKPKDKIQSGMNDKTTKSKPKGKVRSEMNQTNGGNELHQSTTTYLLPVTEVNGLHEKQNYQTTWRNADTVNTDECNFTGSIHEQQNSFCQYMMPDNQFYSNDFPDYMVCTQTGYLSCH
jgi:hypothetical protein